MVYTIIRWIGILLLILIGLLLTVLVLVLFAPIRLDAEGHLVQQEEDAHAAADADLEAAWLSGAVRFCAHAAGGQSAARLSLFGFPVDPGRFRRKKESGEEEEKVPLTLEERCDKIIRTAEIVLNRQNRGMIRKTVQIAVKALEKALPIHWMIRGRAGFETPDLTGMMMALQGLLYPLVCGHTAIEPDFEKKCLDLTGAIHGKIRVYPLAAGAFRLYRIRELRRMIGQIRQAAGGGRNVEKEKV